MDEKYKKLDSFINFTGKFESDGEIVLSEIGYYVDSCADLSIIIHYMSVYYFYNNMFAIHNFLI